jgi:hypothetical protein
VAERDSLFENGRVPGRHLRTGRAGTDSWYQLEQQQGHADPIPDGTPDHGRHNLRGAKLRVMVKTGQPPRSAH